MRRYLGYLVVGSLLVSSSTAAAQNTQRGAAVGGVTGAIAGALIGDHNGEAGAGAAIGAAIGAVTGGVIGNAKDKEVAQQRFAYQQQATYAIQSAMSPADVVALARSGVGDSVIMNQLNQRGVQRRMEVADIISLHQQGVSEGVISAMQTAPVGGPAQVAPAPVVVQQRPVVVETYEVAPVYVPAPRYYYYHGPHHYHRSSVHVGYRW
jgi:uncharacterized membrane protein